MPIVETYNLSELLIKTVNDGHNGLNIGIPFTINKLNIPTGGITKGTYYLILGASKTGKSSFFYDQFIFNLADRIFIGELSIKDVEIILYSLEINRTMIAAKAAVRFMMLKHKILTNIKRLVGVYGKTPIEIVELVKDKDFIKYINIVDTITTIFTKAKPSEMYEYIYKRCVDESSIYGYDNSGSPLYSFKNKGKLLIVAVDHIALINEVSNSTLKRTLDMVSKDIFVSLKVMFGITPVVLQQVNPEKTIENATKIIYGHADARDTKNTFQDCDLCIAIGSPYHENIKNVRFKNSQYHIIPSDETNGKGLLDRFRLFGIEKDRYGDSSLRVAAAFIGETGYFSDMDEPELINYDKYLLNNYKKI